MFEVATDSLWPCVDTGCFGVSGRRNERTVETSGNT
mgnify:CR=1 FL=1